MTQKRKARAFPFPARIPRSKRTHKSPMAPKSASRYTGVQTIGLSKRSKLVFADSQTRCIATVGAAISRPKTFKFLSVSDKRKRFR